MAFFARDLGGAFFVVTSSSENSSSDSSSSDASETGELKADSSFSSSDSDATFLFFCAFAFVSGGARLVPRFAGSVAFFGLGAALGLGAGLEALIGFAGLEAGSWFSCLPYG